RLGLALGHGKRVDEAVREIRQVVESVQTADEGMRLADRHGLELPIARSVRGVLPDGLTPAEGLAPLMARERKPEYPAALFELPQARRPAAGWGRWHSRPSQDRTHKKARPSGRATCDAGREGGVAFVDEDG